MNQQPVLSSENLFSTDTYQLEIASDFHTLYQAQKLRTQVFGPLGGQLDQDRFDQAAFHLVIKTKASEEVIGTYRLICSTFSDEFYSEEEFQLEDFLRLPGIKLELSRAAIHPDHRKGAVLDLLWKGVAYFSLAFKADYLFGLSSLKTDNLALGWKLHEILDDQGHVGDDIQIHPRKNFTVASPPDACIPPAYDILPPLLRSYLLAGAKVYGTPAYDRPFQCFDFFTILKTNSINPLFKRRYFSQ